MRSLFKNGLPMIRYTIIIMIILVLASTIPLVPITKSVNDATSVSRSVYALFLVPSVDRDGYGRYVIPFDTGVEKFIVGVPWRLRGYLSGSTDIASPSDFNTSLIVALGRAGAYSIDPSVRKYLLWAVGNGSTLICNNFFAVTIADVLNITYELVYEPTGNHTVNTVFGNEWIYTNTVYPDYLIKIRGNVTNTTAWINFTDGIHPLLFTMKYYKGRILVYPQYGLKSPGLEKIVLDYFKEYAWSSLDVFSYLWIDGRDMAVLRIDDLLPYMGLGAESMSILESLINDVLARYNASIMLGAVALGRSLASSSLASGLPSGYNFTGNYSLLLNGYISKINTTFIIYDKDEDGKVDTIRYDLNRNGDFDDDPEYTLGTLDYVVIQYNGYKYDVTPTSINSLTSPSTISFGLQNNITEQYDPTIIDTVSNWINQGYVEIVEHGWNHWATGLGYGTEIYWPCSSTPYNASLITKFITKSVNLLNTTFNEIVPGVEIRPYGKYGYYKGDDEEFYAALRKLGVISMSTAGLGVVDYFTEVRMDGAVYVDTLGDNTHQINDYMERLYQRMEPVNIFSHPFETINMERFKYYIWYINNHTDQYILVKPEKFINVYKARLKLLNNTIWNITETQGTVTISLPFTYDGLTLMIPKKYNYYTINGGTVIGEKTLYNKTYVLVKALSNKIIIQRISDNNNSTSTSTTTTIDYPPPTPEYGRMRIAIVLLVLGLGVLLIALAAGSRRTRRF